MKKLLVAAMFLYGIGSSSQPAIASGNNDAPRPALRTFDPPLMGWSSWNAFRVHISDDIIKNQADLMVKLGLKNVGYQYINIDDGFFGLRDKDGNMTPHAERFPGGLKGVADHIHSLGLKAGIYTDAGGRTCGSYGDGDTNGLTAGIYGHEAQDADLYFNQWGFDFIKIDYCGAEREFNLEEEKRYTEIKKAIDATGRKDVSFNICRWAFPGTWAKNVARSWRISGDIRAEWNSIKYVVDKNLYLSAYAGNGHYNDMDMLVVGFRSEAKVGGAGLTPTEEEAHFGLWCIMSSPLLIGCDMANIPESSLDLLKNEELIALNQDPLGLQAYVVQHEKEGYVLVKDIIERQGKVRAVALYNPSDQPCSFSVPFDVLELAGKVTVRDLVKKEDLGKFKDTFTRELPPHSAMILKMEAQQRLEPVRYEAEWAYLPLFNDLGKNPKGISYSYDGNASGRMKIRYLGSRPENYAEWKEVYSEQGGNYEMVISYACDDERSLEVEVNGRKQVLKNLTSGGFDRYKEVTIPVTLKPGFNTVRMGCSYDWAPDIDKFTLKK